MDREGREDMTLQVLVSTCGNDRLQALLQRGMPAVEGVSWLVSVQGVDSVPPSPRSDIAIVRCEGRGLSRNRNNALRHAQGDICLIADDDLTWYPEALKEIIHTFSRHPEADYALFRHDSTESPKAYPAEEYIIGRRMARYHNATSFEIAFRRRAAEGTLFNEHFGVGCDDYTAGEEALWLADLRRAGLRGVYVPLAICLHHGPTTAVGRAVDPTVLHAEGAVIARFYPWSGLPRVVLKAWRLRSHGHTATTLRHLLRGWARAALRPRSLGLR